jgi:hypothetical protein
MRAVIRSAPRAQGSRFRIRFLFGQPRHFDDSGISHVIQKRRSRKQAN